MSETQAPTIPDIDIDVAPTIVPDPFEEERLSPERLCPDQQTRIVKRTIRDLP